MKIIINLPNSSWYKNNHLLTFEAVDITSKSISVKGLQVGYPENLTDFSFKEIFIVDLLNEIEKIYELESEWSRKSLKELFNDYIRFNRIILSEKYLDLIK